MSQARYLPYGETRWGGLGPTDFGFTSQRHEAGFGLMDYNARYYSPVLGRFISADTIVPEPGGSQGWNRYAYGLNNPVRLVDPSGHEPCESGSWGDCLPPTADNNGGEKGQLLKGTTYLGYYDPNFSANESATTMVVGWPLSFMAGDVKQVMLPQLQGLNKVVTSIGKIGTLGTYALPLVNGAVGAYDINQRQNYGMISQGEATLEQANNAFFTTGNTSLAMLISKAGSVAGPVTVSGGATGTAAILSNPAVILASVPSS